MKSSTTPEFIFAAELRAGTTPSILPAGPLTDRSSQCRVPVNLFHAQEKLREFSTKGTCGPLFETSSASSTLQTLLESRLRQRMGAFGSPEYELKWKHWDMPSGQPICALRASPRRTSASDYIGWRTPSAGDAQRGVMPNPDPNAGQHSLTNEAQQVPPVEWPEEPVTEPELAGWATPNCCPDAPNAGKNRGNGQMRERNSGTNIESQAPIAGWGTSRASNNAGHGNPERSTDGLARLEDQAQGLPIAGWCSPMAQDHSRGSLPPRPHDTGVPLSQQAVMVAGWQTPHTPRKNDSQHSDSTYLGKEVQAQVSGLAPSGSPAATENSAVSGWPSPQAHDQKGGKTQEQIQTMRQNWGAGVSNLNEVCNQVPQPRGKLNARFSAWLMGFPEAWTQAAEKATLLPRKKTSSGPSPKTKPAA
jgi:hypothetical protein